MKNLFEPINIGQLNLKNRFVRSATFEIFHVEPTQVYDELYRIYSDLAEGGVGLIITGMMGVDDYSHISPLMIKTHKEDFVPSMRRITDMVHVHGAKIMVQLCSAGAKAELDGKGQPLGPSEYVQPSGVQAKAMTKEDIKALVESFAKAAVKCKEAEVDGVELHSAHGYLLSQFLSPYFNKRTDEYGGSLENRARLVYEVLDAVREAVGQEYPVWIKINSSDLVEETTTLTEYISVCKELEKRGIDAIEFSAGIGQGWKSSPIKRIKTEEDEGSFAQEAIELAENVSVPVISVGGYRTPRIINEWLTKGGIEAIALSRPLICEPALINAWKEGRQEKAKCISCNKCFIPQGTFACQIF